MFIDTHAHIYANTYKDDQETMLKNATVNGINTILMPAIDSETHQAMLDTEAAHPWCLSMMGIHPCSVNEQFEEELRIAEQYLAQRPFIAIGETGLDFYWDLTHKEQQYIAFRRQIEWALHYDVPVVIHSRNANDECIEVVREYQKGKLKGVFHCFSGNREQAKAITDMGLYLGIGGVLTFKNGGLDKFITDVDMSYVVLETDAPYLAPVPYRGKRNEPAYLTHVAQKLADLHETSLQSIAHITSTNAKKLFNL